MAIACLFFAFLCAVGGMVVIAITEGPDDWNQAAEGLVYIFWTFAFIFLISAGILFPATYQAEMNRNNVKPIQIELIDKT